MADRTPTPSQADKPPRELVHRPHVRLYGTVDEAMLGTLLEGIADAASGEGQLAFEVTTLGGDPDVAQRMVLELDLLRERTERRLVFIGKTVVYSAGATLMSAFPVKDRFLVDTSVLLVHTRQLDKTLELTGPLRANLPKARALVEELDLGVELEEAGFERLIADSAIEMDELLDKALHNWYLTAQEAHERRLIAAIL